MDDRCEWKRPGDEDGPGDPGHDGRGSAARGTYRLCVVWDPLDDPNPSMFLDPARRLDCAEREVAAARYHHDLPADTVEWAARVQGRERG